MEDDYGLTGAVDLTAAALELVLADPEVARSYTPGADLSAVPGVGIEPAAPWATYRSISSRCVLVAWRVRLLLARWESGASLDVALRTYRTAAPELRRAGYGVGDLEAPTVQQVGGQPTLVAAYPVTFTAKENP